MYVRVRACVCTRKNRRNVFPRSSSPISYQKFILTACNQINSERVRWSGKSEGDTRRVRGKKKQDGFVRYLFPRHRVKYLYSVLRPTLRRRRDERSERLALITIVS